MNYKSAIQAIDRDIIQTERERDEAVKQAAKSYEIKLAELRAAKAVLSNKKELGVITKPYTGKRRGRKPKVINSYGYPNTGSVLQKFLYVLNEIGHFASIREIAAYIRSHEPTLLEDDIKEKFTKHTYKYRNKGIIHSYTVVTKRNTVYGFPEWLDKEGKVKEGREHDPDFLTDKIEQREGTIFDEQPDNIIDPNNVIESFPNLDIKDMFKVDFKQFFL